MLKDAPSWPQLAPRRLQDGFKMAPRWLQDGSKIASTWLQDCFMALTRLNLAPRRNATFQTRSIFSFLKICIWTKQHFYPFWAFVHILHSEMDPRLIHSYRCWYVYQSECSHRYCLYDIKMGITIDLDVHIDTHINHEKSSYHLPERMGGRWTRSVLNTHWKCKDTARS